MDYKTLQKIKDIPASKFTKYWFGFVLLFLIGWFLAFPSGLLSHMPLFIWLLTAIVVSYKAKSIQKKNITPWKQKLGISLGFFFCIFSFISIPIGFGNPPYSIAEVSIFLSGITLMIFSFFELGSILLPTSVPLITIIGYQIYEFFQSNVEWIAEPLLAPTTNFSVFVINLFGLNATQSDNVIMFMTKMETPMRIPIIIDCTGIWSLGAYTASILLVALVFPKVISKKGILFILAGYVGTYLANILRITLICLSAYNYGASGATLTVHTHAGWIAFSIWMTLFWYVFFAYYLLKK